MKKLKATTVPSDQVKKIISVRDEFKQKFDAKSAETRQKEAELTDIRIKCDAAQKKVTELTEQTAKLTEKDKKNEEDAAKEKDKFRRLQQLAKGYRKQGMIAIQRLLFKQRVLVADKTEEIEKTKQEMESKLSDQQNKDDLGKFVILDRNDNLKNKKSTLNSRRRRSPIWQRKCFRIKSPSSNKTWRRQKQSWRAARKK